MPERLEDSCVSISDFTSQYMTQSMLTNSRQTTENEKSVPLYNKENRSNSTYKQRRTRQERDKGVSTERVQEIPKCRKKSVVNYKQPTEEHVTFNEKFISKIPKLNHEGKSRTAYCSRERNSYMNETQIVSVSKCFQIEKNANLIHKKTIEAFRRLRPTNITIKVIRFLIKLLKVFNTKLNQFNHKETWSNLSQTIMKNSSVVLKEIKDLPLNCGNLANPPAVVNEIYDQLFNKNEKGVPSCSTAFQKECKPFANLLQSVVNYYNSIEKPAEEIQTAARSKSVNKCMKRYATARSTGTFHPNRTQEDIKVEPTESVRPR